MININSVLSSFDDKGTLLKWLKKVQDALARDGLASVSVTQPTTTTAILTFTFADGSTIDSPVLTLPQGETGATGPQGEPGPQGEQGIAGTSVTNVTINAFNHLIITLSDGNTIDAGLISLENNKNLIEKITRAPRLITATKGKSWKSFTWNGINPTTDFLDGYFIWTDGTHIYYSQGSSQYVLNVATSTWTAKTWAGFSAIYGNRIWTDGTHIYYSQGSSQYVLDVATSTWTAKTWNGLDNFSGNYVWKFGNHIFYSQGSSQYVLDVATSTWTGFAWTGLSEFDGYNIWTDGTQCFYSNGSTQYVLSTLFPSLNIGGWSTISWSVLTSFSRENIWTDGTNIYYNSATSRYLFHANTNSWRTINWPDLSSFEGQYVWTDGTNIYYTEIDPDEETNKSYILVDY